MRDTLVVGTAGHIDHGKTSLIKHLTGIDADRLADEKKRGITIDLGFAYLKLNDNQLISFVDVPGHERFIKNMLAGAMGMDAVLIVVAADEGFMPQTLEHLQILSHLNIANGIVVLTKCDLVDEEELEFRREEIKEYLKDSFLENAPVVEYSIQDDSARLNLLDRLKMMMTDMKYEVTHTISRMPIDRVFTIKGHGTVVTGTLIEGKIQVNDMLYHYPSRASVRVKSIQVHNESVLEAVYGQRVALNLAIDKTLIHRGDILSSSDLLPESHIVDVEFKADYVPVKHWQRIRLYHGTKEILGRIATLNQDTIQPNVTQIIQLRLESPLFGKANDPVIIRNFSPLITLGGGVIVNPNAEKHQFSDGNLSISDEILAGIQNENQPFVYSDDLFHPIPHDLDSCRLGFEDLLNENRIVNLTQSLYCTDEWMTMILETLSRELSDFHAKNPFKAGIDRETLRSRLNQALTKKNRFDKSFYQPILNYAIEKNAIELSDQWVSLPGYSIELGSEEQKWLKVIEDAVGESGTRPIGIKDLPESRTLTKKTQDDLLYYLINSNILVKINEEVVILKTHLETCINLLIKHFEHNDELTVAEYRDLLNLSRKSSLELLEYFDRIQLTKRFENSRVLIKK